MAKTAHVLFVSILSTAFYSAQMRAFVPAPFPSSVILKIRLTEGRPPLHVYQQGRELRADRRHIYSVAFDARELVMRGAL
jgi:hypothetical protein